MSGLSLRKQIVQTTKTCLVNTELLLYNLNKRFGVIDFPVCCPCQWAVVMWFVGLHGPNRIRWHCWCHHVSVVHLSVGVSVHACLVPTVSIEGIELKEPVFMLKRHIFGLCGLRVDNGCFNLMTVEFDRISHKNNW